MRQRSAPFWGRRDREHGFCADEAGAMAAEFALIAPIFALILVGAVDFGGVLYVEFGLNAAVSAAADYTLVKASNVSSANGAALASQLVSITSSSHATNWATATVVVNNGPSATGTSSSTTTSGTAANADLCYCPTISGSTVTWGAAVTCGAACAGGSLAGKFVTISAARTYAPIFGSFGIVTNNAIASSTVVQVQ
jgi:Flp pilus assembly protein TadG